MAAQVGISGSTKIGRQCLFGGQVGIAGHITIADQVKLGAQAGLGANVKEEGAILWGSPPLRLKKQCVPSQPINRFRNGETAETT